MAGRIFSVKSTREHEGRLEQSSCHIQSALPTGVVRMTLSNQKSRSKASRLVNSSGCSRLPEGHRIGVEANKHHAGHLVRQYMYRSTTNLQHLTLHTTQHAFSLHPRLIQDQPRYTQLHDIHDCNSLQLHSPNPPALGRRYLVRTYGKHAAHDAAAEGARKTPCRVRGYADGNVCCRGRTAKTWANLRSRAEEMV